jgi:hypothetical protein
MRRWFLGLAVALVAAGAAAADDKAEATVKKAIEAHGGADNLNKYKACKMKLAGDLILAGKNIDFTGAVTYSLPDRHRMEISLEFMGQKMDMQHVVKGETVKSTVTVNGTTMSPPVGDAEKEELRAGAVLQEAEQFTPLLDAKRFTIKGADDEDVNGKKAAVIVVQPKAVKKELKMFFDKESGLLVKTAHRGIGPGADLQPTEVEEESYASDYKKVNGVQVPTKLIVNHDGKKFMTVKVSDYELSEKIDDKEFTVDD